MALVVVSQAMAYNSGDRVQISSGVTNVNVRTSPSTSATIVGQVSSPTKGTVQSGPYSGSGFTWYYVNWDTGINGYTVQDYSQLSFDPPTVTTTAATNVTSTSATLHGTVNPKGSSTTVHFEFGLSTNYGASTGNASAGSGTTIVNVQGSTGSIQPNQTFHYRLVATNSGGTTYGNDVTFTTPAQAPSATTTAATNVTTSGAQLNATINPNGASTTAYFQYGLTTAYGSQSNPGSFGSGTSPIGIQTTLSGAASNTTYHYRIVATNSGGTTYGSDQSFATLGQGPSVVTTAATNVSSTSATLNGTVNPNGSATTAHFEFGLSTNYGASTSNTSVGSGTSSVNVQAPTGSIQPGQTFHYRLVATNAAGTVYGNDVTFVTANGAPYALTTDATNITSGSFQGNAVINPNGLSTTVYFQYGLTTNYTNSNPPGTWTGSANVNVNATLNTNIQPSTTYHYRVVASSSAGTTYGNDVTLTTATGPPTSSPTATATPTAAATPTPTATPIGSTAPTITNVSPNPVIGSTTSQPFTINGSNFSSLSVVNLRNLTNGTPYFNRTINSQTVSRLVINPIFGTEAHTWSVEVVNGTASSGQYQFQVQTPVVAPRPDLVPSNVQVSPAAVQIGNSIAVSVTISNSGPGDAVASTTRVRINASTSSTSSADIALGDIATPTIAAGSSKTVSGSFVLPGGVTVGTNYVWVSVDNNKVTNESDGTNDYAHSPAVSVTSTTVTKPVIQSLTGDQTINHDEVAVLSVTATGSGALSYQWNRNSKPIPGATPSSIRTNQGGFYTVDVSNSGGTTTSATTTLTVNPFSDPPPPGTGSLLSPFAFNSFWPTVVITHGWQPYGDYDPNGVGWQTTMALEIKNRFPGHEVNVLIFAWPEAYSHNLADPISPLVFTASEGRQLAHRLQSFLGPDYQQKLQFVGHSFGTFVNAYAVSKLSQHVDQVSLLDAPIAVRLGIVPLYFNPAFFALYLPKARVDYVDSYIAVEPYPTIGGFNIGGSISGAAPDGGLELNFNHVTMVDHYEDTIPSGNSFTLGFNCSVLLGTNAQRIDRWNPPPLLQQSLGQFSDAASATFGDVIRVIENVKGTSQDVFRLHTSGSASPEVSIRENQALISASDSAVEFEVSIPSNAQYMNFDFRFSQLGDGDWMTVAFADEVLYSFLGKSFDGGAYDEAIIPVSKFAGQTGVIRVILHTASTTPTEVSVANFHFVSSFVGASALGNISTRLNVGLGDNALIGGFIITGTQPKTVIVRGLGPSLASFGIQNALSDPIIEVHGSAGELLATNDDWKDATTSQQIVASGLTPTDNRESALWGTINPGAYTVVVRGKDNTTGVGLFDVYDLDRTVDSKLANISTRGFVDTGNNVMIGGTIIVGGFPTNVLVRAIGPSLSNFGVPKALQDPILELHDGNGVIVGINDDWRDTQEAVITATGIPPSDNRESAIFATLAPGAYTAVVRGKNDSTGVALVEAYQLQ